MWVFAIGVIACPPQYDLPLWLMVVSFIINIVVGCKIVTISSELTRQVALRVSLCLVSHSTIQEGHLVQRGSIASQPGGGQPRHSLPLQQQQRGSVPEGDQLIPYLAAALALEDHVGKEEAATSEPEGGTKDCDIPSSLVADGETAPPPPMQMEASGAWARERKREILMEELNVHLRMHRLEGARWLGTGV